MRQSYTQTSYLLTYCIQAWNLKNECMNKYTVHSALWIQYADDCGSQIANTALLCNSMLMQPLLTTICLCPCLWPSSSSIISNHPASTTAAYVTIILAYYNAHPSSYTLTHSLPPLLPPPTACSGDRVNGPLSSRPSNKPSPLLPRKSST